MKRKTTTSYFSGKQNTYLIWRSIGKLNVEKRNFCSVNLAHLLILILIHIDLSAS